MANPIDFYYPLHECAEDIDNVLQDLTDIILDDDNNNKVVKVKSYGSRLHFIADNSGEGRSIEVNENEIPAGDGEDWVKSSNFYLKKDIQEQSITSYFNTIEMSNYRLTSMDEIPELTIEKGLAESKTLTSSEFSDDHVLYLNFVPQGYSGDIFTIQITFSYKYGFLNYEKVIIIGSDQGSINLKIPSNQSSITCTFNNESVSGIVDDDKLVFSCSLQPQLINTTSIINSIYTNDSPLQEADKIFEIGDKNNNSNTYANKITLKNNSIVNISNSEINISEGDYDVSYSPYNNMIVTNPEINLKGAVRIDIDSGIIKSSSSGTTLPQGSPTIFIHGGAHLDFSNSVGMPYIPPVIKGVCSNENDSVLLIHGNSRILFDNSSNFTMDGDPYFRMDNASFVMHGLEVGHRNSANGFSDQCQFTMNNGFIIIDGKPQLQQYPTLLVEPDAIKFKGHGQQTDGGFSNFSDRSSSGGDNWIPNIPYSRNDISSLCGPALQISGDTTIRIGGDTNDGYTGYTHLTIGPANNGILVMDITPDHDTWTHFKIGCAEYGSMNFSINPLSNSNTTYLIQTKQQGQLQYYLEAQDGFIQLIDNFHIEAQQDSKIIFRANPINNYDENFINSHQHLNWSGVLTSYTNPLTQYDTNKDYGVIPSPICQMLGPVNFTMRGVWPNQQDPHTTQHTIVNGQTTIADAPLFEMTDTSEFRMWNNTIFKIDSNNGVTISDGITTLTFTVAQLAAILSINPVGSNTF